MIDIDTARGGFPADMARAAHLDGSGQLEHMVEDLMDSTSRYVREQPVSAVLWALGIGFILGWRLKPW